MKKIKKRGNEERRSDKKEKGEIERRREKKDK